MIGSSVKWKGQWNSLLGKWTDSIDYPVSPGRIPGLQADYNIFNTSGLIYDGSNRVQLVGDVSGNSNVNALVLNGVAGNYASTPDSAAVSITGSIDVRVDCSLTDWTPSTLQTLVSKYTDTGNQRSYFLGIKATSGVLTFIRSVDGTAAVTTDSTIAPTVSDFGRLSVRVTYDSVTGTVTFYTSSNFSTWTQLGAAVSTASAAIYDSTAPVNVGTYNNGASAPVTGNIYRAQIYNGINGTLAFDANFAAQAKLATSFTESSVNAATVTINTSGQYGARICGARDIVNMTAANQPILTAGTVPFITFDGSNDSLKAAAFSLSQPTTVYFLGSQVTWTDTDAIYDGNATGNRMALLQRTSTPQLGISAGTAVGTNGDLAINTRGVVTAQFNGASSLVRVNLLTASSGLNANTNNGNGFTLGAAFDGTLPSNITFTRAVLYSGAHDAATQAGIIRYLMGQGGVS